MARKKSKDYFHGRWVDIAAPLVSSSIFAAQMCFSASVFVVHKLWQYVALVIFNIDFALFNFSSLYPASASNSSTWDSRMDGRRNNRNALHNDPTSYSRLTRISLQIIWVSSKMLKIVGNPREIYTLMYLSPKNRKLISILKSIELILAAAGCSSSNEMEKPNNTVNVLLSFTLNDTLKPEFSVAFFWSAELLPCSWRKTYNEIEIAMVTESITVKSSDRMSILFRDIINLSLYPFTSWFYVEVFDLVRNIEFLVI